MRCKATLGNFFAPGFVIQQEEGPRRGEFTPGEINFENWGWGRRGTV